MNKFERYLKDNKHKMDLVSVEPKIWAGIEQGLVEGKQRNRFQYFKMASIAAVFLLGVVLYQYILPNQKMEIPVPLLAAYGFKDQDVSEMLEGKINLIRGMAIPVAYKNDLQLLLDQVKYLDEVYAENIVYLKEKDYEEEIAREVLSYYKAKSELLQKVISEMNRINSNEKKYHVKSEHTYIEL